MVLGHGGVGRHRLGDRHGGRARVESAEGGGGAATLAREPRVTPGQPASPEDNIFIADPSPSIAGACPGGRVR